MLETLDPTPPAAVFHRGEGREVRLTRGAWRGEDRIDLRLWVRNARGAWVPTRLGTSLLPAEVPHLLAALSHLSGPEARTPRGDPA